VRHSLWGEQSLARTDTELLLADLEPKLALEYVEDLILRPVHVERCRVALRGKRFDQGDPILAFSMTDPDCHEGVEEPEPFPGVCFGCHDGLLSAQPGECEV
jgi:hypothetical protein